MASGKKAADSMKATPADNLDETPAEPTEQTRDTTTLALLLALTLKIECSANVVDDLLAALEDNRLEVGLAAAAKAHASATFKTHATEGETDHNKAQKKKDKAAR
eukprot:jgi/Tetstr1/422407/TSEL_013245.t1